MRNILMTGAALALLASTPAWAQLGAVGQVTGQVGATASAPVPNTGPMTGPVTSATTTTTRQTQDAATGAVTDTTSTVKKTASGQASGSASADSKGVNASANVGMSLQPGAALQNNTGKTLGSVISVVRDAKGRMKSVVVQTADGAQHVLPAKAVSLNGDAAVTGYTDAQITAAPAPK